MKIFSMTLNKFQYDSRTKAVIGHLQNLVTISNNYVIPASPRCRTLNWVQRDWSGTWQLFIASTVCYSSFVRWNTNKHGRFQTHRATDGTASHSCVDTNATVENMTMTTSKSGQSKLPSRLVGYLTNWFTHWFTLIDKLTKIKNIII